jgi:hypothetical protein
MNQCLPQDSNTSITKYSFQDKLHQNQSISSIIHALKNLLITPIRSYRNLHRVPYLSNGYQYEALAVMEALDQGKIECDIMKLSDSIAVLEITDKLLAQWQISHTA